MGKGIREDARAQELEPVSLSGLIHQQVRIAIETAVHEELRAALGTTPYERSDVRRGYRNGTKVRTLTGPTGPVALTLPRATLFAGAKEWTSRIVPRYHRRMPEVNEAIVATYLADGNTRRIRGALQPLLRAAPLSKSAVSRVTATCEGRARSVAYPVACRSRRRLCVPRCLRPACSQRRESGQRADARRRRRPVRRPEAATCPRAVWRRIVRRVERVPGQSCGARVASADPGDHRRQRWTAARRRGSLAGRGRATLLRTQAAQSGAEGPEARARRHPRRLPSHRLRQHPRRCPRRLRDLRAHLGQAMSGGRDEPPRGRRRAADVLPISQGAVEDAAYHETIERLHEEFRRRVKTQGSLPSEDAALVLLFSLVASGQIKLRRIDGWRKIAAVLSQHTAA